MSRAIARHAQKNSYIFTTPRRVISPFWCYYIKIISKSAIICARCDVGTMQKPWSAYFTYYFRRADWGRLRLISLFLIPPFLTADDIRIPRIFIFAMASDIEYYMQWRAISEVLRDMLLHTYKFSHFAFQQRFFERFWYAKAPHLFILSFQAYFSFISFSRPAAYAAVAAYAGAPLSGCQWGWVLYASGRAWREDVAATARQMQPRCRSIRRFCRRLHGFYTTAAFIFSFR